MKKKIISSLLVTLMITGSSSFSAFATIANGTVLIGNKSFELAYANDLANSTEITNKIIEGGAIYVKDFSGNWIDNTTGEIVDASVIPGEETTSGTTTDLDIIKAKSLYKLTMKDNTGLNYSVNIFSDDNQIEQASFDPIEDWAGVWAGASEGDQLSRGHYKVAVSKDGETKSQIYDVNENEEQILNLNPNRKLITVHKNIQAGQSDFLLMGTPGGSNFSDMKIYYIKDGILKLSSFINNGEITNSVLTYSSRDLFFKQLENNVFETSTYDNSGFGGGSTGFYIVTRKFDINSGKFTYISSRFMETDDYFNYVKQAVGVN
ncbi:hypothetical protein E4V42_17770 [Clostridium estertheticum]|uniref:Uncharacterized protein n=1 Tax=Clostridium estertheticum TaxID=238834 RepID=A0A5N7ISL1_9CLOT|nr:hypothetical protein [Clostridium estertheticum]MPQ33274.1 hypothetical protein [Clostridium estertheticum]MPQ63932.1 hypothetical protein [Clostridium estertheticum]